MLRYEEALSVGVTGGCTSVPSLVTVNRCMMALLSWDCRKIDRKLKAGLPQILSLLNEIIDFHLA